MNSFRIRPVILALTFALAIPVVALAQDQAPAPPPRTAPRRAAGREVAPPPPLPTGKAKWTPEDVLNQEDVDGVDVAKDGHAVAWVKNTADKEKDERVSNLFLTTLSDNKEIQLTRGTDHVSQPRWSPSGNLIAFLGTHALAKPNPKADSTQLWLINPAGGEAWSVTESERGIQQIEWLNDDTIFQRGRKSVALRFYHQGAEGRFARGGRHAHTAPVRLFQFSLKDKKIKRLTDNTDWIEDFEVSRDKTHVVMNARRELSYEWDQKTPPATYVVNLATGERKQILDDQKIVPYAFVWARDNSGFYIVAPYSSDPHF